jgi:DNA-binding transcriptional ArsR family regulator
MTSAFPHQTHVNYTPHGRADLTIDSDSESETLQALSSGTAQSILGTLGAEPKTASEIAERVDTSIQNAQYHLSQLKTNGLVEPVDTWYSARGKEMTVYALAAEELVIQFGECDV